MRDEKLAEASNLIEKSVEIRRVTKVNKGGRRFSFSAFVVVGDGHGKAGVGMGKANEVTEAIRKATQRAKSAMREFKLYNNTIPHEVRCRFGAGKLIMKPGKPGSGIIAAGSVRSLIECIGIRDINVKSLGSNNPQNMVKAAFEGFSQLRSFEDVARMRGKAVEEVKNLIF